jgi:hypothetical protein
MKKLLTAPPTNPGNPGQNEKIKPKDNRQEGRFPT